MKVLIVANYNKGYFSPFILEQVRGIEKKNVEFDFYGIVGKGVNGYLKNFKAFKQKLLEYNPDLIHAHYGLSGLFASLQRKWPVVTTFHGSDVLVFKKIRLLSVLAHLLSKKSIVVSPALLKKIPGKSNIEIIPCSVDLDTFYPLKENLIVNIPKNILIKRINILFSSRFDYYEKNYPLAGKVMELLGDEYNLIELEGYTRKQVNTLLNFCDLALMTSLSEGSPQFIKEAMASNCPIITTDVGDTRWVIGDTKGCYVCNQDPFEITDKIKELISNNYNITRTNGRGRIMELGLDENTIADKIYNIYNKIID